MTALFTSYVINRTYSDLTLKIVTQEKSNVANLLVSLIGLPPLVSCWQDHTDSPTNNTSWFMTLHFIFVTSSVLGPDLKTPLLSRDKKMSSSTKIRSSMSTSFS